MLVFLVERPSIANPYGRANVNEGVEVIIKEKLGRKCAVGGWLLRFVLFFYFGVATIAVPVAVMMNILSAIIS